jgi:DNA polymerase III subunit alpha
VPDGFDGASYFEKVAREGLVKRLEAMKPAFDAGRKKYPAEAYLERFDREVEIIRNMGFPGYFLVVWDFIRAKDRGIPVGPGPRIGRGVARGLGDGITTSTRSSTISCSSAS